MVLSQFTTPRHSLLCHHVGSPEPSNNNITVRNCFTRKPKSVQLHICIQALRNASYMFSYLSPQSYPRGVLAECVLLQKHSFCNDTEVACADGQTRVFPHALAAKAMPTEACKSSTVHHMRGGRAGVSKNGVEWEEEGGVRGGVGKSGPWGRIRSASAHVSYPPSQA